MAEYEDCIVSFIDVLGFKQLVEEKSADDIANILEKMKRFDTGERVEGIRYRGTQPYAFTMSDAIIRVRPLNSEYRDGALFWELYDLLLAQIGLVNLGILVRGGVTIGKVHVGNEGAGPVFGPGLIEAYEIESAQAIYPRIMIDNKVFDEFTKDNRLSSQHNSNDDEVQAICELVKEEDGIIFIDYLGEQHAGSFDGIYAGYYTFLQTHAAMIRNGLAIHTKGNIHKKYKWLSEYHNSIIAPMCKAAKLPENKERFYAEFEVDPEEFFTEITVI
jgi:hypothetical protein